MNFASYRSGNSRFPQAGHSKPVLWQIMMSPGTRVKPGYGTSAASAP
jgi:hypothetical protein